MVRKIRAIEIERRRKIRVILIERLKKFRAIEMGRRRKINQAFKREILRIKRK